MAEHELVPGPLAPRAIEEPADHEPIPGSAVPEAADASPRRRYRGRLFRKYLLLILSLVTIALLASGAISVYFSYQENKSALASLQHEKALAAASRIEQYIEQIVKQLAYAALPQLDASDVELRRIEFLKLLRQAPEVTDIAQLDSAGHEQIAVSRLGMDSINSNKDRSGDPAFRESRPGQPWFSPVYFKKETEPYMTIAIRSGGDKGPVTIADVNLKFIWDVVSRIKIGEKGKAYVVDGSGFLVADPDIGLVLRKTNLSQLPHVKAAGGKQDPAEPAMVSSDLAGTKVLTSVAPIESLKWNVFVEQPVSEVYAKLNASIVRTALLLLAGLVISAVGALALARGMVRPIRTLDEGARRIGAGELDQKIEVRTGDELEALADQFNRMTGRLRESYAGLEHKVEERTHELKNSLDQQTAISEILRVISSSPGDVRPMLNAVAERALKLCDAAQSHIVLVEGDALRFATGVGGTSTLQEGEAMPLTRGSVTGRAVIDRAVIHMEDMAAAPEEEFPLGRDLQRRSGSHAILSVPLMREDRAIGAITLWRMQARAFTDKQIALVKTFADQAAIAIENVRLFNETKEALSQQRASGEVLAAISSSIADTAPVFDKILESCERLFAGKVAGINLVGEDGLIRLRAYHGPGRDDLERVFPLPIGPESGSGDAILTRSIIHYPDVDNGEGVPEQTRRACKAVGYKAVIFAPMVWEGKGIGVIFVGRDYVGAFSEKDIALLKTFADQAVIAIQNARLFNETKEALEQQTAVAEILRVISGSPTDVQPVLEAIAERAARLCDAAAASMYLTDGTVLRHLASKGPSPDPVSSVEVMPINRDSISGRALLERRTIEVDDMLAAGADYPLSLEIAQLSGARTVVVVPLFREGKPFGTIVLRRQEVRPFSERELALLRTFGDQAAIALENVRLFNETKEALDQQRASAEILAAISSSIADTAPVFEKILESCERLFEGKLVGINLVEDDGLIHMGAYHGPRREEFERIFPTTVDEKSGSGIAISRRTVLHIPDVDAAEGVPENTRLGGKAIGVKSVVFAPMLWEGKGIGAIFVGRDYVGPFSDKDIALLKTFADQAVIAIQNARLLREIQEKSKQVEIASQHKMQFLANMSHELRTPLNAILGYSELLFDGTYGSLDDRVKGVLERVQHNGKHLLGLINDVLDLSKMDAGQLKLTLDDYSMSALVRSTLGGTESLAKAKGLALESSIADGLPHGWGDERRLTQVLLNIIGNAIKFTDHGKVEVVATAADGKFKLDVRDTGPGIAEADQARIFEEFQQVDVSSTRRKGGTGLGLAIARRIIEMHGGTISVASKLGAGSTFHIVLPVRVQQQREAA